MRTYVHMNSVLIQFNFNLIEGLICDRAALSNAHHIPQFQGSR